MMATFLHPPNRSTSPGKPSSYVHKTADKKGFVDMSTWTPEQIKEHMKKQREKFGPLSRAIGSGMTTQQYDELKKKILKPN